MKRLVLASGLNQGWVVVYTNQEGQENIVLSGELVNKKISKRKFAYDAVALGELLNEVQPDEILLECDSSKEQEPLLAILEFYNRITSCVINYFPVEFYYSYMGVMYHTLSVAETISVGKTLFPSLVRELSFKSDHCIRPVLMNYCYNKYQRHE